MDKAVLLGKWSPLCLLMLQDSRNSARTVSCSSLERFKSSWRSYRCTIYSDGRRSLELESWFVWRSLTNPTIADRQASDFIDTVERVHR